MTDLEDRIREVLDGEARSAPPPREPEPAIGRARRRQVWSVAGGALGALAMIAVAVLAVRAVGPGSGTPAADPASTVTTTINGISITHPDGWSVFDPDTLELNGPANPGRPGLPRLVLAVSPTDQGELFGCPGMVEGTPPAFLMTIQEEPVALTGDATATWPVPLEPLAIESAGDDPVESGESGCYPGWEFLRAGWTAAGRTFEARVGFAPDVADEDRAALVGAYESLAFEPGEASPDSVVLATGTAGGETWELVAERQTDGLGLTLNGETGGAGGGGFDPASTELFLLETVFGTGEDTQRVVFGAVPVGTMQVNVRDGDAEGVYEVLDVPDSIDAELDAFVFTTYPEAELEVVALDASGTVLAMGAVGPARDPSVAPTPSAEEVVFEGRTNSCFWTLGRSTVGPRQERFDLTWEEGSSVEFVANVGDDAPALQLSSFSCPIDGGTTVFGILNDRVADVRFSSIEDSSGIPDCVPAALPSGFCLFLVDGAGDAGEVIAFDADGNEIGRATFP